MAGKIKFNPAHTTMAELLKKNPFNHLYTICMIYSEGAIIPPKHIPGKIEEIEKATQRVSHAGETDPLYVEVAIKMLKHQLKKKAEEEEKSK